ncbi:haloacid dehalogenase-like hydrolase [Alphaproteobacteria bacterium]|nr:haloacid dehalogenase-like hydrolase [Alphaproteobacteria bacterium]
MNDSKILFVDLDGTLIKEDLSDLALSHSLKNQPFKTLFYLFVFLFKGKPYLKEKISKNYKIPFNNLTLNKSAFDFIKEQKNNHRVVYLISGSHQILVDQMAKYLNIFFKAFGTRDNFNMVGSNKVRFIKENLKINDFDYLGNSHQDLPIWKYTKRAIYTNATPELIKTIKLKNLENREIPASFNLTQ